MPHSQLWHLCSMNKKDHYTTNRENYADGGFLSAKEKSSDLGRLVAVHSKFRSSCSRVDCCHGDQSLCHTWKLQCGCLLARTKSHCLVGPGVDRQLVIGEENMENHTKITFVLFSLEQKDLKKNWECHYQIESPDWLSSGLYGYFFSNQSKPSNATALQTTQRDSMSPVWDPIFNTSTCHSLRLPYSCTLSLPSGVR